MAIVAGTYEGGLVGFEAAGEATSFAQKFGYTPHIGVVKAVLICGKILVSAGTDESVRIYNWAEKKESGQLHFHEGSVTCLASWRKQYLLTGSADTKVALWRMSDWSLVHVFRGHKGALLSLVVHPSGRFAMSLSADGVLSMLDLMRGVTAVSHTVGTSLSLAMSSDGEHVSILRLASVEVIKLANASTKTFEVGSDRESPTCVSFIDDASLLVGDATGRIHFAEVAKESLELSGHAHKARVKSIQLLEEGTGFMI
jgi:protein MAK11